MTTTESVRPTQSLLEKQPLILFDGYCHLCSRSVQWVLKYDRSQQFYFAALQSPVAREVLAGFANASNIPDSFVLIESGRLYTRSTAALRVARRLSGLWPVLYLFMVVPAFLRNAVYGLVARNRFRWFGRHQTCWMPRPEWRSRFIG